MKFSKFILSVGIMFAAVAFSAKANVSLPAIFSNHMVMQQNSDVQLWGWGRPSEEIKVTTTWNSDTIKTVTNSDCKWSVTLATPKAGGPYQIHIQGYNLVTLDDVMMGEVWLLSGQSNMEWSASAGMFRDSIEIANANHPNIRLFTVPLRTATTPNLDVQGNWNACTPETMKYFSAIGYFFGRTLQDSLNVPIGLINTAWGGSPIEIWMPEESITEDAYLLEQSKKIHEMTWSAHLPGRGYNAMIAPLMPFNIAGALWYQGETNVANAEAYTKMLTKMTSDWRKGFQKDFPFYYAQIAPWNGYGPVSGAYMREAQRRALKTIDKSGMVVVSDVGDTTNIHPQNKVVPGIRFAKLALNKTYGKSNIVCSGPLYKSFTVKGKKALVYFDNGEGMYSKGDALKQFEIKGDDGKWHAAVAKIKKSYIEVYAKGVDVPKAVRFAWTSTATPGLFNKAHLPASCFNTQENMFE